MEIALAHAPLPAAPSAHRMDRITSIIATLGTVTRPRFDGIERIPDRGTLFVGNHTTLGVLDIPFMAGELWRRRRIVLRGLGDHRHYGFPIWPELLERYGMVRGTRENVRRLMRAGENILVYPGGADEVFKRREQKYQLLWKERLGFATMAIEFGYPVVPFAAVGAEDMLQVVADAGTPGFAQLSALTRRLVGVPLPPIVRGIGPTVIPRPERLYFWFGDPIDTVRFGGDVDVAAARALRDEVKTAVETGIRALQHEQANDPHRRLLSRAVGAARLRRRPATR